MPVAWSTKQVEALAPDAASVAAARKLASPAPWSDTGADEQALWGACQGSGRTPYQTAVDLDGPAFRCSCPSRKFPCKHAVALLLLWATHPDLFRAPRPPAVDEWLADRQDRAERAEQRAAQPAKEPDREAQAKRVEAREAKVAAGLLELDLWLEDLVRQGLATARLQPFTFWDQAGARLVDAQASGLASRVRALGDVVMAGRDGWEARALEQASVTGLLARAYRNQAALTEAERADVRALVGWSTAQADVLSGPTARDRWSVVGRVLEDGDQVQTERVWLWGAVSARPAVVLSFLRPGQLPAHGLVVGTTVEADLAFYPGAAPLRALLVDQHGEVVDGVASVTPHADWDSALGSFTAAISANPFVDRWPLLVAGCRVAMTADGGVELHDRHDRSVPVRPWADLEWQLAAATGGRPCTMFGEWDGRSFDVVSVVEDDVVTGLL
jgi:hypothetical protein